MKGKIPLRPECNADKTHHVKTLKKIQNWSFIISEKCNIFLFQGFCMKFSFKLSKILNPPKSAIPGK